MTPTCQTDNGDHGGTRATAKSGNKMANNSQQHGRTDSDSEPINVPLAGTVGRPPANC